MGQNPTRLAGCGHRARTPGEIAERADCVCRHARADFCRLGGPPNKPGRGCPGTNAHCAAQNGAAANLHGASALQVLARAAPRVAPEPTPGAVHLRDEPPASWAAPANLAEGPVDANTPPFGM